MIIVEKREQINEEKEQKLKEFLRHVPAYIQYEWMYFEPEEIEQKDDWYKYWTKLVQDYCRILEITVLDLNDLLYTKPFWNPEKGKKLNMSQIEKIALKLIEEGNARWIDQRKKLLEVYWSKII